MPDKSTLLKTFNTQFFSFLDDIKTIYPENKEIAKGKKSFEMIKMASPSIIIKICRSFTSEVYQIAQWFIAIIIRDYLCKKRKNH